MLPHAGFVVQMHKGIRPGWQLACPNQNCFLKIKSRCFLPPLGFAHSRRPKSAPRHCRPFGEVPDEYTARPHILPGLAKVISQWTGSRPHRRLSVIHLHAPNRPKPNILKPGRHKCSMYHSSGYYVKRRTKLWVLFPMPFGEKVLQIIVQLLRHLPV